MSEARGRRSRRTPSATVATLESPLRSIRSGYDPVRRELLACFDATGRLLHLGPASLSVLGWPPERLLALGLASIMAPEDAQSLRASVQDVAHGAARSQEWTHRVRHADGSDRWVSCIMRRGDDGCVYASARDVTAAVHIADDRDRTVDRLRRANADLRTIAGALSHDLREPLRRILILCDRLQSRPEDTESQDLVVRVARAAEQGLALVDGLGQLAAAEAGRAAPTSVRLDALLAELKEDWIRERGLAPEALVIGMLPAVIGQPGQLRSLFTNLIDNALKYAAADRPARVLVDAQRPAATRSPKRVVVRVIDNGLGIPDEHLESVFEPFRRLHARADVPGMGLGLAIVRRIVDAHGGTVRARRIADAGTCIEFDLALASAGSGGPVARASS